MKTQSKTFRFLELPFTTIEQNNAYKDLVDLMLGKDYFKAIIFKDIEEPNIIEVEDLEKYVIEFVKESIFNSQIIYKDVKYKSKKLS
jgi:hypothetical protein